MRKITCSRCGALIGDPFLITSFFVLLSMFGSFLGGVVALLVHAASLMSGLGIFVLGSLLSGACILWFYERFVPRVVKNA